MRWIWAWIHGTAVQAGYVIKPYDMLSDRRRWFWQPRTRCNSGLLAFHLAACSRLSDRWSESDEDVRRALWRDFNATAEALRSNLGR